MRRSAVLLLLLAGCLGGGGGDVGDGGGGEVATDAKVDCVLRYATPQELLILARGMAGDPRAAAVARDVRARPEAARCVAAALPPPAAPAPAPRPAPGDPLIGDAVSNALTDALPQEETFE